jgi:hypothetical protein
MLHIIKLENRPFATLRLLLKMYELTISFCNKSLYFAPIIIVLSFQKELSTRTTLSCKTIIVSINRRTDPYKTFFFLRPYKKHTRFIHYIFMYLKPCKSDMLHNRFILNHIWYTCVYHSCPTLYLPLLRTIKKTSQKMRTIVTNNTCDVNMEAYIIVDLLRYCSS